jgi:PhzF family phenazine biosynthesis protein
MTPATEVDLCGHATLASAHHLFSIGLATGSVRFHTRSGVLTARRAGDAIELDFPATPARVEPAPEGLFEALGARAIHSARKSPFDWLVEVGTESEVRALKPDFTRLRAIPARGVMVTARADAPELDFVSRFFAPAESIDEDPVTGSAHCALAPYWAEKLGKSTLNAFQASRRGGRLECEVRGDRVLLRGRAITMLRGTLANV